MLQNKIIIGNWKMKKDLNESLVAAEKFALKFQDFHDDDKEVVICPNFVSLFEVGKILKNSDLKLGAQDVFWENSGSYTGEISPTTLIQAGASYVIIGHSERRKHLLEDYNMIHQKVKAVLEVEGLIPILCIGEENEDRKSDRRDFILLNQIQQALNGLNIGEYKKIIIAYEPVWAIGSGTVLEADEVLYASKIIRKAIADIFGQKMVEENFRVIYGGSVNSQNVKELSSLENMEGLLVGGASLDAEEFFKICERI